jgi:hypothetical protein
MMPAQELLNQLVGEQLGAVVFVQDYLQLQFDGPQINVYSECRVTANGITTVFGSEPFANHLIGQIAKRVKEVVDHPSQHIVIKFVDESCIEIPYSSEGPEAVYFQGNNNEWGVWPS